MCENCKNLFDIKNNLPYILPCGHSLCEKCLISIEYKNNKLECPIDSHIYEIEKEKIPKNEMLIEYMLNNKLGPKYSYQIREYVIDEATFSHIIRRNCCQKILRFFYKLFYIKIFLTIVNIFLYPFKKIYHLLKKIMNLLYNIYTKIKKFFLKIFHKIKAINLPRIIINCKCWDKMKFRFLNSRITRTIIIFFKYTIRAPLWLNYLKLMKNLLYQSQAKVNNIFIKAINMFIVLICIILVHLFGYFTNNLDNLFILLLLLNESTIVLFDFMKMDDEKKNKKYLKKIVKTKKNSVMEKRRSDANRNNNLINEEEDEYLLDLNKYHRGKKCIVRWIGFIIFWYFSPIVREFLFNCFSHNSGNENNDSTSGKNIGILKGIINSLMLISKLLIIVYLTS